MIIIIIDTVLISTETSTVALLAILPQPERAEWTYNVQMNVVIICSLVFLS